MFALLVNVMWQMSLNR